MPDNFGLRISKLTEELSVLKLQRKQEKIVARIQSKWANVKKRMPADENLRVLAWVNGQIELCWHKEGKWYAYDGTWFFTEKERIEGVSHWMGRDWMYAKDWPWYGPGFRNWLSFQLHRLTNSASGVAHDLRQGGWGNKAQLDKKIIYYRNERTGEIRMGAPEQFPVTKGFQKVICNTSHEAEQWSDKLRQYNSSKERIKDEKREQIEGAYAKQHRSEIHHLMANSRSKYGKEFLQRHLERMDKAEGNRRMVREEFNHIEGYENRR
jgi:hypothetical protein